jgi:hypothetical protein
MDLKQRIEQLALDQHKVVDGEYGCPGLTCPGVQRHRQREVTGWLTGWTKFRLR